MNPFNLPAKNIVVHVNYNEQLHELHTYANEYRSLMMLIYDRIFTEDFGECLGMGKCGTCLIKVLEKQTEPTLYERNGETNLTKAGHSGEHMHLSCQLIIDEKMNGLVVKVIT